jgi:hypothetical protein
MSIWNAVIGGAISALNGRSERRSADRNAQVEGEWAVRQQNVGANQDRNTLLYELQLQEWDRQNRRKEISRGAKNYTQFATMPRGYTNPTQMDSTPVAMPQPPVVNYKGE